MNNPIPQYTAQPRLRTSRPPVRDVRRRGTDERVILGAMVLMFPLLFSDLLLVLSGGALSPGWARLLSSAVAMGFIVRFRLHLLRGLFAAPELALLLALATASVLWSVAPGRTVSALVPFLATSAFAITFGSLLSLRGLSIGLGLVGVATVGLSIALIALFPEARGAPPWDTAWRGIFSHKNGLGGGMGLSILLMISAMAITRGKLLALFAVSVFMAVVLLVSSQSLSPMIFMLVSIAALSTGFLVRPYLMLWALGYLVALFLMGVAIYAALGTALLDPVMEALGRKPTLSGRIPLWGIMREIIAERFWFGYGYHAFWDPNASRVLEIARNPALFFRPYYSHNGAIETMLSVGFAGLSLTIFLIARTLWSVMTLHRKAVDGRVLVGVFVIVVAFCMQNFTESSVLSRGSIYWMVFLAVATKLAILRKLSVSDR